MSHALDRAKTELSTLLRARDLRVTTIRMWVLACLERPHYWTAEEIAEELLPVLPATSASSVYRTLEALEGHGLCMTVRLGPKGLRRSARPRAGDDLHLVCWRCGAMTCHTSGRLTTPIRDRARAHGVEVPRPLVIGVECSACRGTTPMRPPTCE